MSRLKNICDWLTEDEFVEQFIYLTNKQRGEHCTEQALRKAYRNCEADKLLKRLDPIAYYTENKY